MQSIRNTDSRRWSLFILLLVWGSAAFVHVVAADEPMADEQSVADQTINNMKQIMLALHNYHDAMKSFPPAFLGEESKPLLSWRVAILPYFEDESARALYTEFHLDEAWDSEHNSKLIEKMPAVYRSAASKLNDVRTVYLTPRANSSAFPGAQGINFRRITDGTSNTIAVVEVDDLHAVVWTKPDDWNVDPEFPKAGLTRNIGLGIPTAFCDGSVHMLPGHITDQALGGLLTIAGQEVVRIPD
jgi:hypothetical protein